MSTSACGLKAVSIIFLCAGTAVMWIRYIDEVQSSPLGCYTVNPDPPPIGWLDFSRNHLDELVSERMRVSQEE